VTKLKELYPQVGIATLCQLFGKTRHAWYDAQWRGDDQLLKEEIILQIVMEIRTALPRIGTRKLLHLLTPRLAEHHLEVGRDYLFELLATHKLLVRSRRRKVVTTDSKHWMRKYSNLTGALTMVRPEQLWVSDITYIRLTNGFAYLSLITDAYSRKIMGYHLSKTLAAEGCIAALKMALAARSYPAQSLIHHSDRGAQYCCKDYVELLTENKIAISMTQNGDPYENALAERVNGIIKGEFNLYSSAVGFEQTCQLVQTAIQAYNDLRPHASCNYLTPQQAHLHSGVLTRRWKNYPKQEPVKSTEQILHTPKP
jgi:putative transposase